MEQPDADQRYDDRGGTGAVAEDFGEEATERRADQHPVEDVAEAASEPVTEGREEAHIVAEAGLGIGEDAGIDVGPLRSQRLEDPRQHVHAGAGDGPGDDGAEGTCRDGEAAGKVEDAGPDHRAADHGSQGRKRQFIRLRIGHATPLKRMRNAVDSLYISRFE